MTETAKHTPGPWRLDEERNYPGVVDKDNRVIADMSYSTVYRPYGVDGDDECRWGAEVDANARLIAKAPELLAVVRQLQETHMTGGGSPGIPVPEEFGVDGVGELLAYIDSAATNTAEAPDGAGKSESAGGTMRRTGKESSYE